MTATPLSDAATVLETPAIDGDVHSASSVPAQPAATTAFISSIVIGGVA